MHASVQVQIPCHARMDSAYVHIHTYIHTYIHLYRYLFRAMRAWMARSAKKRRLRSGADKCVRRLRMRAIVPSFVTWCENAREAKRQAQITRGIVVKWIQRSIGRAWEAVSRLFCDFCLDAFMHTCMHAYIYSCMLTHLCANIYAYTRVSERLVSVLSLLHTCRHKHAHSYIHTYSGVS